MSNHKKKKKKGGGEICHACFITLFSQNTIHSIHNKTCTSCLAHLTSESWNQYWAWGYTFTELWSWRLFDQTMSYAGSHMRSESTVLVPSFVALEIFTFFKQMENGKITLLVLSLLSLKFSQFCFKKWWIEREKLQLLEIFNILMY